MSSSWSGTSALSLTTAYPTTPPGSSQTDLSRRCLMCHVDHNLFLPDLNPGSGRGMNLRTDIAAIPSAPGTNFTNKDFDNALPNGGICVSCHKGAQSKAYTDPSGTTQTLVIDKSGFSSSAHNYGATAAFKGTGTAQFQANCSKCHDDRLAKRYQTDSVNRFGLHGADWMDSSTVCYSCHRNTTDSLAGWPDKPAGGQDLYRSRAMTPQASGLYGFQSAQWWPDDYPPYYAYNYYKPPTGYRTKHEVGVNPAAHKPGAEGNAAHDGTLSGANRHVECADCHDPHRAQPSGALRGTVTLFTTGLSPASNSNTILETANLDTLTDTSTAWPVPNGLLGWTVKILTGAGAGTTSTIFANTATSLTVKFAFPSGMTGAPAAPVAGSTYAIISNGALNAVDSGGALQGAWGVEPAVWPAQPSPPDWYDGWGSDGQPFQNGDYTFRGQPVYSDLTLTRTTTPSRSAAVCLKCHSSYAYGNTPPWSNNGRGGMSPYLNGTDKTYSSVAFNDFTIAGGPGAGASGSGCTPLLGAGSPLSPLIQAAPMGCVMESDIANEFNPNNLAHHAVFAPGKNQPMVASDTVPSVYNPSWPQFTSYPTTSSPTTVWVTNTGTDKIVTLRGTNGTGALTWPVTTLPGWFLYIGSAAPAQGIAGWYQVTAVQSPTQLTVDRVPPANTGNTHFMLTPGLAATFVPPWGPWSTLKCTDCHASDDLGAPAGASDPFGPHGSGQKWLLRKNMPKTYPVYSSSPGSWAQQANAFKMASNVPIDPNVSMFAGTSTKTNFCLNCHRFEAYGDFQTSAYYADSTASGYPRVQHPPGLQPQHYEDSSTLALLTPCLACHGGARIGSIHGSNNGKGHTSDYAGGAPGALSYSGKRLLNGATLVGITRPSKGSSGTCFIKSREDSVNVCAYAHQNSSQYYRPKISGAAYDYESGADP